MKKRKNEKMQKWQNGNVNEKIRKWKNEKKWITKLYHNDNMWYTKK